jgi:hypothetical protein
MGEGFEIHVDQTQVSQRLDRSYKRRRQRVRFRGAYIVNFEGSLAQGKVTPVLLGFYQRTRAVP